MRLVKRYPFDQTISPDWNASDTLREESANAVIEEGALSLWTRPNTGTKGDPWKGTDITLQQPRAFGKYAVDLRVDQGVNIKSLLMLIYPQMREQFGEDQEIDFLEQGGNLNFDRHMVACTAHHGQDEQVRRTFQFSTTDWCTVVCNWQPFQITYTLRPLGDYSKQQTLTIPNPGIFQPIKMHMAYRPQYGKEGGPWPTVPSRMQVREVRLWQ